MIMFVIGVVVVVAVVVALFVLRRRPLHEPGFTRFRRHMDALSPEARRTVLDRATQPTGGAHERRGN